MTCRNSIHIWTLTLVMLMTSAGCGAFGTAKLSPTKATWNPKTWFKNEFQEPISVATIWKADSAVEAGQPGQRGFGARVYFYNDRSQSVPVDGDLVVHGFLTTPSSSQGTNDQADKKFTFSAEQLASQYSPTDLGASYSIWIPWDDEDGFREEVTLVTTFKSKLGAVIQGAPTRLFLPGKPRFSDDLELPESIQKVSYEQASIPTYDIAAAPAKGDTKITTIDVPNDSQLSRESEGVRVGGSSYKTNELPTENSTTNYNRQQF